MLIAIRNLVFGCFSVCLLLGCGASSDDSPASVEKSGPPPVSSVEEESDPAKMTAATLLRKLKDANPDYNNNAQAVDGPDGYVAQVALMESGITDITPLRGTQLTTLDLGGVPVTDISPLEGMPLQTLLLDEAQVEDLSPLKGMPLSVLRMNNCPVSDISALKAMPLTQLNLYGTKVTQIEVVEGMPLNILWLTNTAVTDLSPLKDNGLESLDIQGTPIKDLAVVATLPRLLRLNIAESQVTDLTPLKDLTLQRLVFTPKNIRQGIDVVRAMPSIQQIGPTFEFTQQRPPIAPTEFWKLYDKGEFHLAR